MPDKLSNINWCQLDHASQCPLAEKYSCGIRNQLREIKGPGSVERRLNLAQKYWEMAYKNPEQYTKICKKGLSLDFV